MYNKPIMGVAFALLMLASVGAAFAMWSDTVRINGTINTGEVKVAFGNTCCNDTGVDPQAPGFDNSEGKDVASCLVTPEIEDDEGNVIKLNVTISNAYPGYKARVCFEVVNVGSIPVKLYNYSLTGVDTTALDVDFITPASTQIHGGMNKTFCLDITVLQSASQDHTYTFELEMVFAQWNEVSTP